MADELNVLLDSDLDTESLNSALNELQGIFEDNFPYEAIRKTYGICYKWSDLFIERMLKAFATDNLEQFSEEEIKAWYQFVMFQNYHSHSALESDGNGTAVGCTIPNSDFKSFVVLEDGTITTTECQEPRYDVQDAHIWASLDRAMIALYNCEPIDSCNIDDNVVQTVPCSI